MGEKRRNYNPEFKKEVVELSYSSDKTIKEIAEEIGTSHHNIVRWRQELKEQGALAFPGNGHQKLTPHEEEIQKLKKELRDVKEERDILKKAMHIFSKDKK